MKYRDHNFSKFQDRQRDYEPWGMTITDRQARRQREHAHRMLYMSKLSKLGIDKDWWNCLKPSDKSDIDRLHAHQESMMELAAREQDCWSTEAWFSTWEEWTEHVLSEYRPDPVAYREARLKKIGV